MVSSFSLADSNSYSSRKRLERGENRARQRTIQGIFQDVRSSARTNDAEKDPISFNTRRGSRNDKIHRIFSDVVSTSDDKGDDNNNDQMMEEGEFVDEDLNDDSA